MQTSTILVCATLPTPAKKSFSLTRTPTPKKAPKSSVYLTDVLKPTTSPMTTSFFAEHSQMKMGLEKARLACAYRPASAPLLLSSTKHTTSTHQSLLPRWARGSKPSPKDKTAHSALVSYNNKYRGLNTAMSEPLNGKCITRSGLVMLYRKFNRRVIYQNENLPLWKQLLPTRSELHSS